MSSQWDFSSAHKPVSCVKKACQEVQEKGGGAGWGRGAPSLRSAPSAAGTSLQGCPSSQEGDGGTQSPPNFRKLLSTSPKSPHDTARLTTRKPHTERIHQPPPLVQAESRLSPGIKGALQPLPPERMQRGGRNGITTKSSSPVGWGSLAGVGARALQKRRQCPTLRAPPPKVSTFSAAQSTPVCESVRSGCSSQQPPPLPHPGHLLGTMSGRPEPHRDSWRRCSSSHTHPSPSSPPAGPEQTDLGPCL